MTEHRQRGVALLSVLLVTALVTLVVADMLARQRLSLAATTRQMDQQHLWQMALSGETWARQQLRDDLANREDPPQVHLGQGWARTPQRWDLGSGQVQVRIEDLAGRFDLDHLRVGRSDLQRARYQRLLAQLDVPAHDPARLPTRPGPGGKAQGLLDASELLRLGDLAPQDFARLAPHVATLGGASLNLNTASAVQLASLEGLDPSLARTLVQARPADGWATVQDFLELPLLQGREVRAPGLAVDSRFFRIHLLAELGERRLHLASDLRLEQDGHLRVLRRQVLPSPSTTE